MRLSGDECQFQFLLKMACCARKDQYTLHPVSRQSPYGCSQNSADICLVEHRSFMASFLHSSFLQAINAVMLWPVHVQKVPQASEYPCPAKLQTRCDICFACQSICPFIPTDSGLTTAVDPRMSSTPKTVRGCVPVKEALSRIRLLQQIH